MRFWSGAIFCSIVISNFLLNRDNISRQYAGIYLAINKISRFSNIANSDKQIVDIWGNCLAEYKSGLISETGISFTVIFAILDENLRKILETSG